MATDLSQALALAVASAMLLLAPGRAAAEADSPSLSGGLTLIGFAADDGDSESELSGSLDLFVHLPYGPGSLIVYVEGSTTPRDGGVSIRTPEANADAGTALDRDGEGRLQVSELKYAFSLPGERTLDVGLLDVTAYLDTTRINNDENMQFLGTGFLNNPSIAFPDYTLGVVYHQEPASRGPALSVALTGSEGLADNADASYGELFELADEGKGVFLGAEAGWQTRLQRYRLGAWIDTAERPATSGSSFSDGNHGFYLTVDRARDRHAANLRVGVADEDASPVASFASLTYQLSWQRRVLGLGAARAWSSEELPGAAAHATQLEAYLRVELREGLFLTPSVEHVSDSAFGSSPAPSDVLVFALRLRVQL